MRTHQIRQIQSNHSKCHKRNCIKTPFKSTIPLQYCRAEETGRKKSASNVRAQRLHTKLHQTKHQQNTVPRNDCWTDQNTDRPAVPQTSETITRLLKPYEIEMAHKLTRTLRMVLSKTKEPSADKDRLQRLRKATNWANRNKTQGMYPWTSSGNKKERSTLPIFSPRRPRWSQVQIRKLEDHRSEYNKAFDGTSRSLALLQ